MASRFSKRAGIRGVQPSIHRCGGSAGSESRSGLRDSFRFPLNCHADLHSEHQPCDSKPLSKCHCNGIAAVLQPNLHLQKTENLA